MMIQAVQAGLSQSANASYAQKNRTSSPTASHFERKAAGQFRGRKPSRRPNSRGSMNGQAMQKKLPAASKAKTVRARQYVHGSTPARFTELI